MEGIDDPLDFKAGELQTLDENFRCPICKEFYDTAMILSTCSHTFCAICIRRSLAAEQCCPKCRTPCHDSKLHNNYDMDNVVHAWKLSRKLILDLEVISSTKTEPITTTTTTTTTTEQQVSIRTTTLSDSSQLSLSVPLSPTDNDPNYIASNSYTAGQSQDTSASRRSSRLKDVTSQSEDPNLVTCPICQQKMKMEVLNQHIDLCLNGDSTIPSLPSTPVTPQQIQPLPTKQLLPRKQVNTGKKPIKIVYDMYKEKDLRRMLKNLDLPDYGDKSQMVWRYKEYVTMYNANMDSPDPMDISKLIKQLQKAENLQFSRMTNKRSVPDANEHKQKYGDEYKALIESARKKRNSSRPSEEIGESSTSRPTIDLPSDDDFQ